MFKLLQEVSESISHQEEIFRSLKATRLGCAQTQEDFPISLYFLHVSMSSFHHKGWKHFFFSSFFREPGFRSTILSQELEMVVTNLQNMLGPAYTRNLLQAPDRNRLSTVLRRPNGFI